MSRALPLLAAAAALGWSAPAAAQPVVDVEVSERTVIVGDSFNVRFVVKTEDRREGRFEAPAWKNLAVVGKSRQKRMQVVRSVVSSSLIYDFKVKAKRKGVVVIPAARYEDRTGSARSRPINLRVEAPKAPAAPTPGSGGGLDLDGADVALVATADKDRAVRGEQLTLTYTLYTQVRISEYAMDEPEVPGFWKEDVTTAKSPKFHRRVVGGVPYEAAVVRRYLLFPLQVGNRFVPSTQMRVEKSVGMFRSRSVTRRSNSLNLTVTALPPGAPRGFTGAVGKFRLKVSADRSDGEVGMPVGVKIKLSGTGNFKHFELPLPKAPDGLKAHPPTTKDRIRIQRGRMVGERVFEWILTPQRAGRFNLGAMRFPYFDPSTGEYRTAVASPVSLRVKPGARPTISADPGGPAAGVAAAAGPRTLGEGEEVPKIRPLKAGVELVPMGRSRPLSPWQRRTFWFLTLLAPGLWMGLLVSDRLRARRVATSDERVVRGALRRAKRRLQDADDYVAEGRTSTLYGEVARTMIGYIDDRTGGRTAGLSFGELGGHLAAAGYTAEDVAAVMAELEHADAARFTPAGSSPDEMRLALERAAVLLRRLDRHQPLDEVDP